MDKLINIFDGSFWTAMFIGYLLPKVISYSSKEFDECEKHAYSAYITSCFICEKITFVLYYKLIMIVEVDYLIQSGILLTILLIFVGRLIEKLYDILKVKNRKGKCKICIIEDKDKIFIIGVVTLALALDLVIINYQISLFCISLVLGKYFWIDTGLLDLKGNIEKIKKDWKSISNIAKKFVFIFAIILLASNYVGFLLGNKINIKAYIISIYISIGMCIVYYTYKRIRK